MIALDAMGGDYAPNVTVHGAIGAAKRGIHVALFGDEPRLRHLLDEAEPTWQSLPITISHCTQTIAMGEEPTRGVLKKTDSSLVRAVHAVADGVAHAVVSAGNSGAALAAGTLIIGRVEDVARPAIGGLLPTRNGYVFCADLGATTDCKPEYLEQFALMGHVYAQQHLGIAHPRIALLSNGHEPYKGSSVVKQAYALLVQRRDITFVGNLEARDIFEGHADVLVCDGFTGNIMLKTIQGTLREMATQIKQEVQSSWIYKVAFAMNRGIVTRLKSANTYRDQGRALMLGLQKPMIIAHGCSSATAIEDALLFADQMVRDQFLVRYNYQLSMLMRVSSHAALQRTLPDSHVQTELR